MARKPRIEFEGAFYHVLTRGNQKQEIFREDRDFSKYLQILIDYKNRYRFLLYAYVLMPNHVHLLVETKEVPLSKILQGINQRYTMYFNWKYDTVGHLFQGRYKAILCDKDAYLLKLIKYIHYNPVKAGIVNSLDKYLWSSHGDFIKASPSRSVDSQLILSILATKVGQARRLYREFMEEANVISEKDLNKTVDQRILGDEDFAEQIMTKAGNNISPGRALKKFSLEEIAQSVQRFSGINQKELRGNGKSPKIIRAKKVFTMIAREYGYKGKEMAAFLRKDPAAITRYLKNPENLNSTMGEILNAIENRQ
jgi:REP element-mobilizing transposase RayT